MHEGMLRAARYIVDSIWESLMEALRRAPGLPILVTGEREMRICELPDSPSHEGSLLVLCRERPAISACCVPAGHSMGGGISAVVALMLRNDTRLLRTVNNSVRGVCIAPAAVFEDHLSESCQDFLVSVVYGRLWRWTRGKQPASEFSSCALMRCCRQRFGAAGGRALGLPLCAGGCSCQPAQASHPQVKQKAG